VEGWLNSLITTSAFFIVVNARSYLSLPSHLKLTVSIGDKISVAKDLHASMIDVYSCFLSSVLGNAPRIRMFFMVEGNFLKIISMWITAATS
jgi:hypothetical protein